ncbi:hypothetical protein E0H75_42105 [Kribbella capetownensis]|uniref:Uncharacterized protein n=1 Tax=Kribbella capetownensis TaxID=1572659 RepID=A0A4R0IQX3_9ACTN|nr:hypothetical protein [Kribbella capetownensis]TCC33856.1 hypothetical protein E0H75_42105 [Kribbella capetownensis]
MSTPTINTPHVRPAPYARSSRPSLDHMQARITPAAGVTVAAATSTWLFGDRASGQLAAAAGVAITLGTIAIAAGPVVEILNDARDGHLPRGRDLSPAIAAVLAALATAAWSGLWLQLAALVLGSAVIVGQVAALVHEARIQLGKGVEW